MKKFINLKYVTIFCLLMVFNSCSDEDNSLEIIEEKEAPKLAPGGSSGNSQCSKTIYVKFNFAPSLTYSQKASIKYNYYNEMRQEFTICARILGNLSCEEYEKWIVDINEYNDYLRRPNDGQDRGTNSGKGNDDGELGSQPPRDSCFSSSNFDESSLQEF